MGEETEWRKRKERNGGGGEAAKTAKTVPAFPDAEGEVDMEEADAATEVMKWLEEEMCSPALPHSPSSPSYRQETSFVTINGNEESCGPSFSCSASTVMASVDTSGGVCGVPYFVGCPSGRAAWPSASPLTRTLADRSAAAPPVAMAADECRVADEEEDEEVEWLARALGAGGAALKVEESRV